MAAASNNGSMEAVKALDIPGMLKEWVAVDDERTRDGDHGGADHLAMDGKLRWLTSLLLSHPTHLWTVRAIQRAAPIKHVIADALLVYKLAKNGDE